MYSYITDLWLPSRCGTGYQRSFHGAVVEHEVGLLVFRTGHSDLIKIPQRRTESSDQKNKFGITICKENEDYWARNLIEQR
jgi:hypothetical protein